MKFSMIGQEKGDLLIQVTAWRGLTVFQWIGEIQTCVVLNKNSNNHKFLD